MRRALLRNVSLYTRTLLSSSSSQKSPFISKPNHFPRYLLPTNSHSYSFKFFSSENDSSDQNPKPSAPALVSADTHNEDPTIDAEDVNNEDPTIDVEDVSNKELKKSIEKYMKGDQEEIEHVLEGILSRKLKGEHEETDEELIDELEWTPIDNVGDEEFEDAFESEYSTDEDVGDLYSATDLVVDRMMGRDGKTEGKVLVNPDEKVWAEAVRESAEIASELGPESGLKTLDDLRELEEILEDMRDWDKLLPDDIKKKVEAKFDELGDKCERQELLPEEAYQHFKEFEDQIVADYIKKVEVEDKSPKSNEVTEPVDKTKSDDPPGVGPILRWQTRVVFSPGGDAWHPKNRKVKLSVTVKELGLTKYQFRRLREIVGNRYHPGKDELTITSERFEHREENRKDCLRTLLGIIEEAGKATALVEEARTAYVKQRLKANPAFMARLHAKTKQASAPISA